jgi:hypothetical protein
MFILLYNYKELTECIEGDEQTELKSEPAARKKEED